MAHLFVVSTHYPPSPKFSREWYRDQSSIVVANATATPRKIVRTPPPSQTIKQAACQWDDLGLQNPDKVVTYIKQSPNLLFHAYACLPQLFRTYLLDPRLVRVHRPITVRNGDEGNKVDIGS